MPREQLVEAACRYAAEGYPLLTLKGSADWRADITNYLAVREALPAGVRVGVRPEPGMDAKRGAGG